MTTHNNALRLNQQLKRFQPSAINAVFTLAARLKSQGQTLSLPKPKEVDTTEDIISNDEISNDSLPLPNDEAPPLPAPAGVVTPPGRTRE